MMESERNEMIEEKINLKEVIRKFTGKWYYFLIVLLIMIPLAYAYVYFADNYYLVRASILLNGEVKNGLNAEKFLKGMELMTSQTELEDEIGILKSYSLSESTIKKLDFGITYYSKSNFRSVEQYGAGYPFKIELDSTVNQLVEVPIYIRRVAPGTYSVNVAAKNVGTYNFYTNQSTESVPEVKIKALSPIDKPFAARNLSFRVRFNSNGLPEDDYYFVIHNLNSLANYYREELDVKPVARDANMVEVKLRTRNPAKGILMLNTLLDVYRANELDKKNQLGFKTIHFIDDQLGGVTNELRQVETSLESFRSRNNILDINTTAENYNKRLDRLEADRSILEQKLKYYKYIAASLDKETDLKKIEAPSTFGLEDPVLNNLLMDLTRLNQERIGLNYSTKEGNPVAEVLELKIASARKSLIENVNNFIGASTQALADIDAQTLEVRRNVQGLPRSERELVNIKRRFDFNDNVYNYLLEKRAEAGIAIASNTVEKTIVDRARLVSNEPISPNKRLILMATIVLGFLFTTAIIIVHDAVNDNLITSRDIEHNSHIPSIGTIPHGTKSEQASIVVTNAKSAVGESFRSLRVNLQYLTLGSETSVIGITSSVGAEGKTFCSVNLAAAIAQSGKKTVIIDADLRKPKVHTVFNLKNEKGLSNYLIGNCTLKDIINYTTIKGLDIIPSGPIPPNPVDLIGLPRMAELIEDLKHIYNTIIIDSPPVGFVSEFIILMKYTNANLYVVRSNHTNRYHLEKINRLYEDKKISNVSILLNDSKTSLNGYGYRYHYN